MDFPVLHEITRTKCRWVGGTSWANQLSLAQKTLPFRACGPRIVEFAGSHVNLLLRENVPRNMRYVVQKVWLPEDLTLYAVHHKEWHHTRCQGALVSCAHSRRLLHLENAPLKVGTGQWNELDFGQMRWFLRLLPPST